VVVAPAPSAAHLRTVLAAAGITVTVKFPADRSGRAAQLGADRPHRPSGLAQIGDLDPFVYGQKTRRDILYQIGPQIACLTARFHGSVVLTLPADTAPVEVPIGQPICPVGHVRRLPPGESYPNWNCLVNR